MNLSILMCYMYRWFWRRWWWWSSATRWSDIIMLEFISWTRFWYLFPQALLPQLERAIFFRFLYMSAFLWFFMCFVINFSIELYWQTKTFWSMCQYCPSMWSLWLRQSLFCPIVLGLLEPIVPFLFPLVQWSIFLIFHHIFVVLYFEQIFTFSSCKFWCGILTSVLSHSCGHQPLSHYMLSFSRYNIIFCWENPPPCPPLNLLLEALAGSLGGFTPTASPLVEGWGSFSDDLVILPWTGWEPRPPSFI